MDALNHADQMRLANLINDNSDDAEIQKKLDQVVELTSSTRDQAAVALHDCHYDVEKAVDMILECGHAAVENQWKPAGKKKNKNNSSQAAKTASNTSGGHQNFTGSHKNSGSNNKTTSNQVSTSNSGPSSGSNSGGPGRQDFHQPQHHTNRTTNQAQLNSNQFNNGTKQDAPDNLKNLVGISSSNLIYPSDSTTAASAPSKTSSLSQQQQQQQQQQPQPRQQQQQQQLQRSVIHQVGNRHHHQRSTRIPDSAVEMPSELQVSSLNVQFGELDLKDGNVASNDAKGSFQDVLDTNRLTRQPGTPNPHSTLPSQDNKGGRQLSQQNIGKMGPRRSYNHNNDDNRRFYNNNQNRGGRQFSNNQRPHSQRPGQINNNSRGVRTIMSRGPQQNSSLPGNSSNQSSGGFPNSIDTWSNSTAEAATKSSNVDQISVGNTLRVGQWSDVAGNEDWSEEDWDAKVMETKVFTPSSKAVDGPASGPKNQPLLSEAAVSSQINLASKLSESVRDDIGAQQSAMNAVNQQGQSQQASQKPITHMNDIFDASVAKVLEQQNLVAMKPKASIGMSQYNKESPDAKTVLDQQNLSSIKPKTSMSMNQYNKEASESLKSLVGISSAKGGVPSVPPGALPLMSQPQYIMSNAYHQTAIFPYAYQTPDVHYQVAPPNAGREQNFQSLYSHNDANKFNRGSDGGAQSIQTTQAAPVASQAANQAFVTNALHAGYPLTYAMPGAFNMTVLDQQNLNSIKPKTTVSVNQYNKEASGSLKSLVGISSGKGGVPSVSPGALPLMSQHQYIMGNAYPQPAIFPYAYQTPDVHYQVAPPNAGREQNFQSVYSHNDANKFNRGSDGGAQSIQTTQAAPVASQAANQAFVTNALHSGYPLTYDDT